MKVTTVIDKDREEEIVIYLRKECGIGEEIERLLERIEAPLVGYREGEIIALDPKDVFCFITEGSGVYAVTEKERVKMKRRLYEIEEILDGGYVRLSQSCIANISKIERFEVTIGASLRAVFKNGYRDTVSRRQLKKVKERFLIK